MKTLYLHVGTPKTATSSIQVFCGKNNEKLHEYGYSFPHPPFQYPSNHYRYDRNAHFLVEAAEKVSHMPANASGSWQQRLEAGLAMIHDEFQQYDNVILTDESLWRSINYNRQSPLKLLLNDAASEKYQIKVIVYLRRQDSFLCSLWNQNVKEGSMRMSLSMYLKWKTFKEPLVTDYSRALNKLAASIGKDNIIVRRFEPSSWVGHSIYTDFLDAIGLRSDLPFAPPEQEVNPGLKGNAVEIQRMINYTPSFSKEDKVHFCTYLRQISMHMDVDDQYNGLSDDETQKFLSRFLKGNKKIAAEYFNNDQPLFAEKNDSHTKWSPDNPYLGKDLLRLIQTMSEEDQSTFFSAVFQDLYHRKRGAVLINDFFKKASQKMRGR